MAHIQGINDEHLSSKWSELGDKQKDKLKDQYGSDAKDKFREARERAGHRSSGSPTPAPTPSPSPAPTPSPAPPPVAPPPPPPTPTPPSPPSTPAPPSAPAASSPSPSPSPSSSPAPSPHHDDGYNPNQSDWNPGYGDAGAIKDFDSSQYGGADFGNKDYDELIRRGYSDKQIGDYLRGNNIGVSKAYRQKFGVGGGAGGGFEAYKQNYGDVYNQKVQSNDEFMANANENSGIRAMGGFEVSKMSDRGLVWDSRKPVSSLNKADIERYGIDITRKDIFDTQASRDINGRQLTGGIDIDLYNRTGTVMPEYVEGTLDPNAPADGGAAFRNAGGYNGNQNEMGAAFVTGDYRPAGGDASEYVRAETVMGAQDGRQMQNNAQAYQVQQQNSSYNEPASANPNLGSYDTSKLKKPKSAIDFQLGTFEYKPSSYTFDKRAQNSSSKAMNMNFSFDRNRFNQGQ